MIVTTTCPVCHALSDVIVGSADYKAWQSGLVIQEAMPHLSVDDREKLITGFCSPCWDRMFA